MALPMPSDLFLPILSENALIILKDRYFQPGDTPQSFFWRIAAAIAEGEVTNKEQWARIFYDMMANLDFLPNSPCLRNTGTGQGSASACYVISPDDNLESIMQTAHDAAMIEKWGGGIGFGLSKLRPKGDNIKTTAKQACGPVAVMKIYSKVGEVLTQGAFRLGAHMGQLRCDHPDIEEFIHCKDQDNTLHNFNISVQVTDEFMRAIGNDGEWGLINPRTQEQVAVMLASDLWKQICESAWKTGDPGIAFIDRVNETKPIPTMPIHSSNPCAEEFLEDYSSCNLASINLANFINHTKTDFDWLRLGPTIKHGVRFLDDVVEVNQFPLPKLREMNLQLRRIGLGVMGWADALSMMEIPYNSQEALDFAKKTAATFLMWAKDASAELAQERGPFPLFSESIWADGEPLRNACVTCCAPTGTISRIANCSSGIEPHFALAWESNVLWKDHQGTSTKLFDMPASLRQYLQTHYDKEHQQRIIQLLLENPEEGKKYTQSYFPTAHDISPEYHVRTQAAWQIGATNSISKTINCPHDATVEDISQAFFLAWKTGCKSTTVYRDGSKSMQVLETAHTKKHQKQQNQEIAINNDEKIRKTISLPSRLSGERIKIETAFGTLYINVNFLEGKPVEVFLTIGKAGGTIPAFTEALGRMISMSLRSGIPIENIIQQLSGISCQETNWWEGQQILSIPDAIAKALKSLSSPSLSSNIFPTNLKSNQSQLSLMQIQANIGNGSEKILCPKCGKGLYYQEGCLNCTCGFSKCS